MLNGLMQQHAATFFTQAENASDVDLPQFVKDEFDVFLKCGILAHGFLRLRSGDCGHDKLVAFSCKRRGFARRAVRGPWRRRRRTWEIASPSCAGAQMGGFLRQCVIAQRHGYGTDRLSAMNQFLVFDFDRR